MDPRVSNNLDMFATIFGELTSYKMDYSPVDYRQLSTPYSAYYVNVPNMLQSSDMSGMVELQIGKAIKIGSPLAHTAYINKYVPPILQSYITGSEVRMAHGVHEIIIKFTFVANSFKQIIGDAYSQAFDRQFTEALEYELTKE